MRCAASATHDVTWAASLHAQAQRLAHRDRQALPEGSTGDLHAWRVGGHAGHRQAAVIRAVGLQLLLGQHAGFEQCRVQRDRIVAVGEQETVPAFPLRLGSAQVHGVAVGDSQDVRPAQGLADIALALHFTHAQREAPDPPGMFCQACDRRARCISETLGHLVLR